MDMEWITNLQGRKKQLWADLLKDARLQPDLTAERTLLLWDGDTLIAAGSRTRNLLKCIAVKGDHQGEGHTATVLTQLRQDALCSGFRHLFLYTKPENAQLFQSMFFYPVARTGHVLLMENQPDGIRSFLAALPLAEHTGPVGSIIMNCNPFTRGHRHLIETACRECAHVYVFVLSEDVSRFSAADRLAMVKLGTRDLKNITVLPTGPYLISNATFPTYFLKDPGQSPQIQCSLDVEIFANYCAPRFSITRRYAGTEPLSHVTRLYNETLRKELPRYDIEFIEVPRLSYGSVPISASAVRAALESGEADVLDLLIPESTRSYLKEHNLISF